jgi:hypothetical protein
MASLSDRGGSGGCELVCCVCLSDISLGYVRGKRGLHKDISR